MKASRDGARFGWREWANLALSAAAAVIALLLVAEVVAGAGELAWPGVLIATVALVAWWGGPWLSLAAAAGTVAAGWYFVLPPTGSFELTAPSDATRLLAIGGLGILVWGATAALMWFKD